MRSKNGFTLIELLITITIMAVLLTLTVVSLRSSQAVARDEERKADVTAIAQALENYYNGDITDREIESTFAPTASLASFSFQPTKQEPTIRLAAAGTFYPYYQDGYYPPTAYFANESEIRQALRSLDLAAIRAPGVGENEAPSLKGATSTATQSPDINTYIYQPLAKDGSLCDVGATSSGNAELCREFTLYYRLETTSGVQTITSKHR